MGQENGQLQQINKLKVRNLTNKTNNNRITRGRERERERERPRVRKEESVSASARGRKKKKEGGLLGGRTRLVIGLTLLYISL